MQWTRSDTIGLAKQSCSLCHGLGMRKISSDQSNPCNCVFRAIFRACYGRFRYCATKQKHVSHTSLEFIPGRDGKLTWGRKDEEYVADFCLVSRRALDEFEYRLFKYHFLLGADWRLCTRQLHIDRGNFFHSVYRIEQRLGRVFRELRPYALYPLSEYFQGDRRVAHAETTRSLTALRSRLAVPLANASPLPLRRSA